MVEKKRELKQFIEEQIKMTGFTTEIDVIEEIEAKGWDYVAPHNYYDRDEDKWRDIDIVPFRCFPDIEGEARYKLCFDLAVECKKSSNHAWVFFVRPEYTEPSLRRIFDIDYIDDIGVAKLLSLIKSKDKGLTIEYSPQPWISGDIINNSSILISAKDALKLKDFHELRVIRKENFQYFTTSRIGLYGKEVKVSKQQGKGSSGIPQIFEALTQVNKALSSLAESDAWDKYIFLKTRVGHALTLEEKFSVVIEILIPVVVFDGYLYSWEKDSGVIEREIILARSLYRSRQYNYRRLVPVVRVDHLKDFLASLDKDVNQIYQSVSDKVNELDQQTKNFINALSKNAP